MSEIIRGARMQYKKPKHPTEANVQAELYRQCCITKLRCTLEYTHSYYCEEKQKKRRCRFDAIIHDNDKIYCIIECKRPFRRRRSERKTKQIERYEQFGVPVLVLREFRDVRDIIDHAIGIMGVSA